MMNEEDAEETPELQVRHARLPNEHAAVEMLGANPTVQLTVHGSDSASLVTLVLHRPTAHASATDDMAHRIGLPEKEVLPGARCAKRLLTSSCQPAATSASRVHLVSDGRVGAHAKDGNVHIHNACLRA